MSSTQNNNNINENTNEASKLAAIKDQALGAVKEALGSVLGNDKMILEGKAQKVHGHNEYQFAKAYKAGETEPEKFQKAYHSEVPAEQFDSEMRPVQVQQDHSAPISGQAPPPPAPPVHSEEEHSKMSGLKDQAIGSIKETIGSATNNSNMEMAGKAQSIHGHNEAAFANAQKEGRSEPEHFEHGTKKQNTLKEKSRAIMSPHSVLLRTKLWAL
jgi:uncharacterized protein YjbJ (UPF0337 family)